MIRFILLSILLTILFRALSRLWAGVVRGMQEQAGPGSRTARGGTPQRGVQMQRDPVCGTFVVPDRALALPDGAGHSIYFCSVACRDQYRARPDATAARAHGRTA